METAILKALPGPVDLISQAIDKGLGVAEMEKLLAMQERWEANQARKEFFSSLADFQSKCPEIRKNKTVDAPLKDGGRLTYNYAPLPDIERQIKELMKECGLTKRWETSEDNTKITVTCIITHTSGHSERTTMTANADDSGRKNSIQARASSITYMQRYTLIGALGIATADNDIDGRFAEKDVDQLHKDFMSVYNQVIQIDSTLSKWHPDNWKVDKTASNYVKALGQIRKVLFDLQPKDK